MLSDSSDNASSPPGLLFAGYAAAMVPANMVLPLVGGPRWLAFLCVAWGAAATASAAIHDAASFLALRCLLGITEVLGLPAGWGRQQQVATPTPRPPRSQLSYCSVPAEPRGGHASCV